MITPHNLYIHVPYCTSKCNYCAFYSVCSPDWDAYVSAIIRDIKYWAEKLGRVTIPTIFFGGGTPSLMPTASFEKIMDVIRTEFDVASDAEVTLESNPGTLFADRLRDFIGAGVTRLSVGVQSLDDDVLKFLGRGHTAAVARRLIDAAHANGIRVAGDFIYALPHQSVAQVRRMCRDILELGLCHASCYELSVDAGTPFARMNLELPDNNTMADMYTIIRDTLAPNLRRYEISNYAVPGFECRHNANVWAGDPYIGIGPAAAGRILIDDQWYDQYTAPDVNAWLCPKAPILLNAPLVGKLRDAMQFSVGGIFTPIDTATRAIEKIMTGLRTAHGVWLTPDVQRVIDWAYVQKNPNLFSKSDDVLSLTDNGRLILDAILSKVISDSGW